MPSSTGACCHVVSFALVYVCGDTACQIVLLEMVLQTEG